MSRVALPESPVDAEPPSRAKWRHLGALAIAELLAMSPWFSASAVVPQLAAEQDLSAAARAWLTISVQLGFVAGALVAALLNLADRLSLVGLIAISAVGASLSTGAIALCDADVATTIALRGLTGMFLAGVYPPGMKLVATWSRADRGLMIGVLIGALTLGSALPHLWNALPALGAGGMPPWRPVLWVAAACAMTGAVLVACLVRTGPLLAGRARFDWRSAGAIVTDRGVRLANLGYLGHMWELYAMWTWAPICLLESWRGAGGSAVTARLAGFLTVAAGTLGCVVAGRLADGFGRTAVAIGSLAISGGCCLVAGSLVATPVLLTAVCIVWGVAVVADSAQFSAAITELADPRYVGTALTMQTCLGFLLTAVTIHAVPLVVESSGWRAGFALLAVGPVVGIAAMLRLRALPIARAMASGRR